MSNDWFEKFCMKFNTTIVVVNNEAYISFCLANYHLKLNIGGVFDLVHNLCNFVHGATDYIPNVYHWDLYEWLDHNRE